MTLHTLIGRSIQAFGLVTMLGGAYGSLHYLDLTFKLRDNLSQQTKEFQGLEYKLDHGHVSIRTLLEKPELLDQYKLDDVRYVKLKSDPAVMAAIKAEISSVEEASKPLRNHALSCIGSSPLGMVIVYVGDYICKRKKKEV